MTTQAELSHYCVQIFLMAIVILRDFTLHQTFTFIFVLWYGIQFVLLRLWPSLREYSCALNDFIRDNIGLISVLIWDTVLFVHKNVRCTSLVIFCPFFTISIEIVRRDTEILTSFINNLLDFLQFDMPARPQYTILECEAFACVLLLAWSIYVNFDKLVSRPKISI